MATVLSVSGSPSATSRTARLATHLGDRLSAQGHTVLSLDVRSLPAEALLWADRGDPAIAEAVDMFAQADGVVVATPIYKAAYTGLLKSLLDLLPQAALAGKTVLPLATGGTAAHVLAIDYALRPVLSSMAAHHIVQGWFVLDRDITLGTGTTVTLEPSTAEALYRIADQFSLALCRRPLEASAA